jgi:hypothetical protein
MCGAFVGSDIQPLAFYISPSVGFALKQPEGKRQLRVCFDQASPITSLSDCMALSSLGSTLAWLFVRASTATAFLVPSARWSPLPWRQTDRAQITIRTGARTWLPSASDKSIRSSLSLLRKTRDRASSCSPTATYLATHYSRATSRGILVGLELHVADMHELLKGTPHENSSLLFSTDEKAWLDGDLIRLLVV